MDKLKDWLYNVIVGLVSKPEMVQISALEDEQGILFNIKVDKQDSGKVIGKKGNIAESIRTLLRSAGAQDGVRASMKLDVPENTYQRRDD